MDQRDLAAAVGAVACALAVIAVAAPYVVVPADRLPAVAAYYGLGAVTPLTVGLLGLVGVVAFLAGLRGRTEPGTVAGLMLAAGAASLVVALQWALLFDGLRPDLVEPDLRDFLSTHRWWVVAATSLWTVAAAWYARALGLLGR